MFSSKPLTPQKLADKIVSAIDNGNVDKLKKLLAMEGADVNLPSGNAYPLTRALISDYVCYEEMFDLVMERGAKPRLRDLTRACGQSRISLVRKLIEAGAAVNGADDEGATPLHVAARCGQGEIVKLLLAEGANPNIRNNRMNTPADVAEKDYPRVAEFIRSHPSYHHTETNDEWKVTGRVEISHVSEKKPLNLVLTEIFNFETRVYIGIVYNPEGRTQSQTMKTFSELVDTQLVERAAAEMASRLNEAPEHFFQPASLVKRLKPGSDY